MQQEKRRRAREAMQREEERRQREISGTSLLSNASPVKAKDPWVVKAEVSASKSGGGRGFTDMGWALQSKGRGFTDNGKA